jgi:hypothetical protein
MVASKRVWWAGIGGTQFTGAAFTSFWVSPQPGALDNDAPKKEFWVSSSVREQLALSQYDKLRYK